MTASAIDAPCGRLEGTALGAVTAFKGIPFGRTLRWQPAERLAPWSGIRGAQESGAIAPQNPNALDEFIGRTKTHQSEDCLNLNIYAPNAGRNLRPVMVWIHGGAFVTGSGCFKLYDGQRLASRGVVVVTINYRLGALGFLRLADITGGAIPAMGTEGLGDQILALTWVRDNIEAFGGDPRNVTIFGESAGAMSVAGLLASPAARGLFHKAILQSGAGHHTRGQDYAERVARAFMQHLGASSAHELERAPTEAILKAQASVIAEIDNDGDPHKLGTMPFRPIAGTSLLPADPIAALRDGAARSIPLMVGTTAEEWKLWTALDAKAHAMDAAKLERFAHGKFADHAPALIETVKGRTPYEGLVELQTHRVFREPANRFLTAQARHAPVFDFLFEWRSPMLNGAFGACHGIDLGFTFGTHTLPKADQFFGDGHDANVLANTAMDFWASFARSGTPQSEGQPAWSPWAPAAPTTMILGSPGATARVAHKDSQAAWNAVPDTRVGP